MNYQYLLELLDSAALIVVRCSIIKVMALLKVKVIKHRERFGYANQSLSFNGNGRGAKGA